MQGRWVVALMLRLMSLLSLLLLLLLLLLNDTVGANEAWFEPSAASGTVLRRGA